MNYFMQFLEIIFSSGWTFIGFIILFSLILSFICEIHSNCCEVKKKKFEYKSCKKLEKVYTKIPFPNYDMKSFTCSDEEEKCLDE